MKKYNKIYYRIIFVTMCFVLSSVFMLISGAESLAKSKGIKLRYNGKTSINRSKQMSVTRTRKFQKNPTRQLSSRKTIWFPMLTYLRRG